MAERDEEKRTGPDVTRAGRLLANLHAAGNRGLEGFRERRCPKGSDVDLAHLRRARDILDALAAAIEKGSNGPWRRVEAAWRILVDEGDERKIVAALQQDERAVEVNPPVETAAPPPPAAMALPPPPDLLTAPAPPPSRSASDAASKPAADQVAVSAPGPLSSPFPPEPAAAFAPLSNPAAPPLAMTPAAVAPPPQVVPPLPVAPPPQVVPPPVAPPPVAPPPPIVAPPPPPVAAVALGVGRPSAQGALSPWLAGGSLAPVNPAASAPELPESASSGPGAAGDERDGTGELDVSRLAVEALPFKGSSPPPMSALPELPPLPSDVVGNTDISKPQSSAHVALPFKKGSAAVRQPNPTAAPEPAPPPPVQLTLEQVASLHATCAAYPDAVADTERRYGITSPDARRALDAHWAARFQREPGLYTRFGAAFVAYRDFLIARRRNPGAT